MRAGPSAAHHFGPGRSFNQTQKTRRLPGARLWLLLLFLVMFTLGTEMYRGQTSAFWEQLADAYSGQNTRQPMQGFASVYLSAAIQIGWIVLCAFSAFGSGLLPLQFAAKGFCCGALTWAVYQAGGVSGLLNFWLTVWLPDTLLLILGLQIAPSAMKHANEIFRWYFLRCRTCTRNNGTEQFMQQCLSAMLWSILIAALSGGMVWFCGVIGLC